MDVRRTNPWVLVIAFPAVVGIYLLYESTLSSGTVATLEIAVGLVFLVLAGIAAGIGFQRFARSVREDDAPLEEEEESYLK